MVSSPLYKNCPLMALDPLFEKYTSVAFFCKVYFSCNASHYLVLSLWIQPWKHQRSGQNFSLQIFKKKFLPSCILRIQKTGVQTV